MKEHYFCTMEIEMESSWRDLMQDELSKSYFAELIEFIDLEYKNHFESTFPKREQIFRAFNGKSVNDINVVIIGQDPYPTKGHANGLCFSLQADVKPFAKSLNNIFKEIESDLGIPIPENGDLTRWADQGVLLLNSILTVHEGKPLSHKKKGWEQFTDAVVRNLISKREGIVFLVWGATAIEKMKGLDLSKHFVFTSPHPSPLSSYRGFFGNRHFSQANKLLISNGKNPINW